MKILRQFRLLILLSCVLAALTASLLILHSVTDKLNTESQKIKSEAMSYKVRETREKLNRLDSVLTNAEIPTVSRTKARRAVLSMAEKISKVYPSRLLSDVIDDGSSYSIKAEITLTPYKTQDLTDLIHYFDISVTPVIKLTNTDFFVTDKTKSVKLTVKIIQPYKGGQYVF